MNLKCINTILPFIHGNQDRIWFKKIVFKITIHYRFDIYYIIYCNDVVGFFLLLLLSFSSP